jgi:hypothetical protein
MRGLIKTALIGGSVSLALSLSASAQNLPQPPDYRPHPSAAQPLYDPRQLPAQRGQVQQFTLTPRDDIDGLILTDNTEVKTPPHLSTQIAYAIRPGDMVTIHGLRAAALPLVQAVSITDDATGRTVIDDGPPGPGREFAPPPPGRTPLGEASGPEGPTSGLMEAQGRVRMALHGPQGETNGALLDDGTIVRLPPPEALRFASLLQPGQTIVSEGTEETTPMGTVIDARQIGASPDQLNSVEGLGAGRRPPAPESGPPAPPRP